MAAAVRNVYELVPVRPLPKIELDTVWGLDLTATNCSGGTNVAAASGIPSEIKVAVCNGLGHAKKLIKQATSRRGDFMEVMACPSGYGAQGQR